MHDTSQTHTWVRHTETGGYWQCPNDALDVYLAKGWEITDPPAEPNPAIAERLAWQAQQQAPETATAAQADTPRPRAARRDQSTEGSES